MLESGSAAGWPGGEGHHIEFVCCGVEEGVWNRV